MKRCLPFCPMVVPVLVAVWMAGCTPSPESRLFEAVEAGDAQAVKLLLVEGVDVNARDGDGRTPLHQAVKAGDGAMVRLLVENGADANAQGDRAWTPLHVAVVDGDVNLCNYLIDNGANINAQIGNGSTPLSMAWMNDHQRLAIILRMRGGKMPPKEEQNEWVRDQLDHLVQEHLRMQERMTEEETRRRAQQAAREANRQ